MCDENSKKGELHQNTSILKKEMSHGF